MKVTIYPCPACREAFSKEELVPLLPFVPDGMPQEVGCPDCHTLIGPEEVEERLCFKCDASVTTSSSVRLSKKVVLCAHCFSGATSNKVFAEICWHLSDVLDGLPANEEVSIAELNTLAGGYKKTLEDGTDGNTAINDNVEFDLEQLRKKQKP